ncbi:hypothetical protein ACFS4T_15895 [Pseudomonas lini]
MNFDGDQISSLGQGRNEEGAQGGQTQVDSHGDLVSGCGQKKMHFDQFTQQRDRGLFRSNTALGKTPSPQGGGNAQPVEINEP